MAETLYRKYRPKTFTDVTEQEHIKQTIGQEIKSGQIAHAFLFCGPRGVGKTTIARLIAKAVNCAAPVSGVDPCNQCASCMEIEQNRSLDIIEIDAASQTGVDQVRENIIANAKVASAIRKYKVFIIDEVHMLSTAAFNALLKTLEEPPKNVLFILATTEIHKVPMTIISRCQRFDFKKISTSALGARLKFIAQNEGFEVSPEVVTAIAKVSQGYLRDALSLLGQILSLGYKKIGLGEASLIIPATNFAYVWRLTEQVVGQKSAEAVQLINQLASDGTDIFQFTSEWIEFLRLAMLAKISNNWKEIEEISSKETASEVAQKLAGVAVPDLVRLIELLLSHRQQIKTCEIAVLPLELAVLTFCQL
ncbi:DNA polymerase III subunit gamma/tau [Candidatus Uhrbacteria bacterium]|nr:DNA polymerase III subunit gamma/tau [Candidatus Uhrbacteria bacterium]